MHLLQIAESLRSYRKTRGHCITTQVQEEVVAAESRFSRLDPEVYQPHLAEHPDQQHAPSTLTG